MFKSKSLKSNYSLHKQVESFFSGPEFEFDASGDNIYCPLNADVNKVCVSSGQVLTKITASTDDDVVLRIAVSSNNEQLAISHHSGLISIVGLEKTEHKLLKQFKSIHSAPINCLKYNETSTLLATGSADGTIKVWNLINKGTPFCSHNLRGLSGVVTCIKFLDTTTSNVDDDDCGKKETVLSLLFAASGDNCVHAYDLNKKSKDNRIGKFTRHQSSITALLFSNDQKQLLTCGRDQIATVWDISNPLDSSTFGQDIRTIPINERIESAVVLTDKQTQNIKKTCKLKLKPNSILFATIGEMGRLKIFDSATGVEVLTQNKPPMSADRAPLTHCFQMSHRPNSEEICVASHEMNLFFYQLPNLELVQQLQGQIDEIFSACWFGNQNSHLALATNSKDLKIMELKTARFYNCAGHTDNLLCVKNVFHDPYIVISSAKDCLVIVWKFCPDTMKPTILFRGSGHTHAVHCLAVLYNSKVFFSGSEDQTLKMWQLKDKDLDCDSEQQLIASQTIKAHDNRIDALAISPNDELIATGSRDKIAKIFSVGNLHASPIVLKGHRRGVLAVQFSPVNEELATASGDATIKLWRLKDYSCTATLQGHNCSVLNFTFISSGMQIMSAGSDGNVKLWLLKTNECTKTIDAHEGNIWTLSATDDDDLVVTAAQDGALKVWQDCTVEDQETKLQRMQNLVMQEQEFSNFVNKKAWKKAFILSLKLEDSRKTLKVVRELMLDSDAHNDLKKILTGLDKLQLNFVIECCIEWASYAKNSIIAQTIFNIIVRSKDNSVLLSLPGLTAKLSEFEKLTEKSFNRYERLVQDATFVDFFLNSFKLN